MDSQQRKARLVVLLKELLEECDGVKGQLAQKLNIKPSTLTPWLQGKIDPTSLDVLVFIRLAQMRGVSVDRICASLGITSNKFKPSLKFKFRNIIKQLLSDRSQQELADLLQISRNAISRWSNPEEDFDPTRITIDKMVAIADEKGWTIERLLIYLGLKEFVIQESSLFELQSRTISLPLKQQITFLNWLFNFLFEKVKQQDEIPSINEGKSNLKQPKPNNSTVIIILEQEDLTIASNYFSNLVEYLKFQAKNIKIATIPKLPQSLADIDILIFDINTADSPSIQLIEDLTFNGDIIIFADAIALPLIRDKISSVVSEIFAKPVDWSAKQIFSLFSK